MDSLLILTVVYLATAIPLWVIMRRVGQPWWAAATALVPLVNIVVVLGLAVFKWPIPDARDYGYGRRY